MGGQDIEANVFDCLQEIVSEHGSKVFADGAALVALLAARLADPRTQPYRTLVIELVNHGSIVDLIQCALSPRD